MNSKNFNLLYWKHYMILEQDFMKILRYVELDRENFNAFSVEFNKLLQAIGSEFDVICKEICKFYNQPNKKYIYEYAEIILQKFSTINSEKVLLKDDNNFIIEPLKDWRFMPSHRSPTWWKAYNDVKHNRTDKIKKANMENVLHALASLYLIEMYFIYEIAIRDNELAKIPDVSSFFFEIRDWKVKQFSLPGKILLQYK